MGPPQWQRRHLAGGPLRERPQIIVNDIIDTLDGQIGSRIFRDRSSIQSIVPCRGNTVVSRVPSTLRRRLVAELTVDFGLGGQPILQR